jgi:hypothetical protein
MTATDAWRVQEIRAEMEKYHAVLYDETKTVEEQQNWAFFTLGAIQSLVAMSDTNVAVLMEKREADR